MKKVAIMQPYFFPYIGYLGLIKHTDRFILLDTVQYMRHGWIERNRILKLDGGWTYIKVPLKKHDRYTQIKDVQIDNTQAWADKIIAQLGIYKKIAPNYLETMALVKEALSGNPTSITVLNKHILELVCQHLGVSAKIETFSEMDLKIQPPNAPDEWALNICLALGDVDEYWNAPGGVDFFEKSKYERAGIKINFMRTIGPEYNQHLPDFQAGLSIIDTLMFNSRAETNKMLDTYEFV